MSSKREGTMPIRIDEDVHEWIMSLKEAMNAPNVSVVLREALRKAYPEIEQRVGMARGKKDERHNILVGLVREREP